tara:strand:- start:9097 stop:10215 length:1119 start_codon:yes stop_codon:yes gene_type:complete
MNKKILLFANSDSNYIHFRMNLIKKLLNLNYKVFIIVSSRAKFRDIQNKNLFLINLKFSSHNTNFFLEIILLLKIFFIYLKIKPDFVLHFTIKPNIYGSVIAKILKIKSINNITGLGNVFLSKNKLRFFYLFLYKLSIKKSFHNFFQNKSDLRYFRFKKIINSSINNYSIIPGSGIDLSRYTFQKYPDLNKLNFLYVGRLIKQKGIVEFIEAAKQIKSKFKNCNFIVAGDFEKENSSSVSIQYFENAIKNKHIEYLGYINNIKNIIKKCHVIVLPSYREGLSHSLLLSAAIGRPLIASHTPGCRELILEGNNGFLIRSKNVDSLIYKISKFINLSNEKKIIMGNNSRKLVIDKFDERIVIDQYLNYINKEKL